MKLRVLVPVLAISGSLGGTWACGSRTGIKLIDEVGNDGGGQSVIKDSSGDVFAVDVAVDTLSGPDASDASGTDAADVECSPGSNRCYGNAMETCGTDRQWGTPWPCATGSCSGSACTGSTTTGTSCAQGGLGLTNCGVGGSGSESCCTSLEVPGGTFYRSYDGVIYTDKNYPATVSGFRLDKYEITVGRFRQFVNDVVGGWLPAAGAGRHTYLNGGSGLNATGGGHESGWDATEWNGLLATTLSTWTTNLSCSTDETWTGSIASNENLPINCETWYEAYAFCIWDSGFLPSEAEWNYAAAGGGGGNGQRAYAWSSPSTSTTIDCSYANYYACPAGAPNNVGSESPTGDGLYGQAGLGGNVWEWNLDWYASPYANPSIDCANLMPSSSRVFRGGSFYDGTTTLLASYRLDDAPAFRYYSIGARCSRSP